MRIIVDDKGHMAGDLDKFGALTYRELLDALKLLPEECLDFPVKMNLSEALGVKEQIYEFPHFGLLSSLIIDCWSDPEKNIHYEGVEFRTTIREA